MALEAHRTPALLSIAEVSEHLCVSRSQIYNLLARGELDSVSIGRSRRIPVEAVHAYLNELREREAAYRNGMFHHKETN